MLPRIELGDFILYDGKPAKIVTTAEGRQIGWRYINREHAPKCHHCGVDQNPAEWRGDCEHIESAPIVQDHVVLLRPVGSKAKPQNQEEEYGACVCKKIESFTCKLKCDMVHVG